MDENAVDHDKTDDTVTDGEPTVRVPRQRLSLSATGQDDATSRDDAATVNVPAISARAGARRAQPRVPAQPTGEPTADETAGDAVTDPGVLTGPILLPLPQGGLESVGLREPALPSDGLVDVVPVDLPRFDEPLDDGLTDDLADDEADDVWATTDGPAPPDAATGADVGELDDEADPSPRLRPSRPAGTPRRREATGLDGWSLREPYRAHVSWERKYTRLVIGADLAAGALAAGVAYLLRFGDVGVFDLAPAQLRPYLLVSAVFPVVWVLTMALNRTYEGRFLGGGSEEFRRVVNAAVRLIAVVAVGSYTTKFEVARAYVLIVFPLATLLTLISRVAARWLLHRMRRVGRCQHRVLVVGAGESAASLVRLARRDPSAGWNVVGVCLDRAPGRHSHDGLARAGFDLLGIPIVGTSEALPEAIRLTDATTVAISPQLDGERLRRALWALEGSNVDVLVSSAVTDVTGPRIHLRPVAGLPLLHIEEPELTGARRLMKGLLDRGVALVALTLLAPLLLGLALAVRLTSRGPAIFRQTRVGRGGREFTMFKFRSMFIDAEARLAELTAHNEREDEFMFKIRNDPRITRAGGFLRKWSLDEVPQLFNVLNGSMSLVGPRPPLPREVAKYADDVHRRLMVKPGLTGLWQVSGRSDLPTDEAVRLDLRYVENWSLAMDLMILWKTVFAVIKREGAY
ncbi:sugar transferase [Frankia sp. AgB1.9]|nr:sugar transferase [Frankia sp. AgW1.1]MBL7546952.1 sugar transferase [Frankia sp. AgB1.9]MBL7620615.1 sugar transferase [Frankia sp. AgB1.8]